MPREALKRAIRVDVAGDGPGTLLRWIVQDRELAVELRCRVGTDGRLNATLDFHFRDEVDGTHRSPDCDLLDGGVCFWDRGYKIGDDALGIVRDDGEDALWAHLQREHRACLAERELVA